MRPATAVVFVHGFLADGALWSGVADLLAARGVRSYAPDWPLGSHGIALRPHATSRQAVWRRRSSRCWTSSISPLSRLSATTRRRVVSVPRRHRRGPHRASGAHELRRVRRLPADTVQAGVRAVEERRAKSLAGQMRPRVLRHSWVGFGLLARNLPASLTRSWIEPGAHRGAIQPAAFVESVSIVRRVRLAA